MLALIDDDGCFGVLSFSVGGLSVQLSLMDLEEEAVIGT
ncbi:unnamed protein product [Brassica oleracea var. botrytis]